MEGSENNYDTFDIAPHKCKENSEAPHDDAQRQSADLRLEAYTNPI